MSFLLPLLPSLISAGAGLYGAHKSRQSERRANRGLDQFGVRPGEEKRFERFTPQQQQIHQLLQNLLTGQGEQPGGLLGETFGQEGFDAYADPAIKAFNERIAPGIAERFAGMGAGSQSSSGFQNALAGAGKDLATGLGQLRSQQRQGLTQGLLSQVFEPQFNTRYEQRGPSGGAQALGAIGGAGAQGITQLITDLIQNYINRPKKQQGISAGGGARLGGYL